MPPIGFLQIACLLAQRSVLETCEEEEGVARGQHHAAEDTDWVQLSQAAQHGASLVWPAK